MFDVQKAAEEAQRVRKVGATVVALANIRRRLEAESLSSRAKGSLLGPEQYGKILLPTFSLPGEENQSFCYRSPRHYHYGMTLGQCTIHYGVSGGIVLYHERRISEVPPWDRHHVHPHERRHQDMFFMPAEIAALITDAPDPDDRSIESYALRSPVMLDWFERDLKKISHAEVAAALDNFTNNAARASEVLAHYRTPKPPR